MDLARAPLPCPVTVDASGNAFVLGTGFALEGVIARWLQGSSPEEIARSFRDLTIEAVYVVVAYYLRNRSEVDRYLAEAGAAADDVLRSLSAAHPPRVTSPEIRTRATSASLPG
jgi:uncharacterized protein (DUF433 family)